MSNNCSRMVRFRSQGYASFANARGLAKETVVPRERVKKYVMSWFERDQVLTRN